MARKPNPWYWEERGEWCVNVEGERRKLGSHPDGFPQPRKIRGKWNTPKPILARFFEVMAELANTPVTPPMNPELGIPVAEVYEKFLEWCQKNREPATYDYYHIRTKFDACSPSMFPQTEFPFIWAHPPYWRMKLYTDDPRDLSRQPTLDAFLERYGRFLLNCAGALTPGGKLAVLMGDYTDREAGFVPLVYHTKRLAFAAGLRQCCTDIVRFSHGASSSKKVYRCRFIPGLHDICAVFVKPAQVRREP